MAEQNDLSRLTHINVRLFPPNSSKSVLEAVMDSMMLSFERGVGGVPAWATSTRRATDILLRRPLVDHFSMEFYLSCDITGTLDYLSIPLSVVTVTRSQQPTPQQEAAHSFEVN